MKYNVAIVGATGLVGQTFLKVLEKMDLQIKNLYLYASMRSEGKSIIFKGKEYQVIGLSKDSIRDDLDIALFSAGGGTSKEYSPLFAAKGCVVIDNSSAFRMDPNVPLVVPEVNPDDTKKHKGIIANPNCSTIQSVVPLKVLKEEYGIKRVDYSTYQAVSGSGVNGIKDLELTTKGEEPQKYKYPIYNNCLPQIDVFLENGYTFEEIKMIKETQKILGIDELAVSATCVRVPVLFSHSVDITVELASDFDVDVVRKQFEEFDGIIVIDDTNNETYPLATIASGEDEVFVGRLRKDLFNPRIIHMWCVADNIRKGAATNTIQIAKLMIDRGEI